MKVELAYDYAVLLKPKVLLAMLGLYLTTFFTSSIVSGDFSVDYFQFFIGFMAVALSVSGANALNCVYDHDIDTLMTRTSGRPLVRGTISLPNASLFSWVTLGLSAILAVYLGVIPLMLLAEGAGSYLLLYTVIFKRKTSVNVLFTAPSVAAPAWFGWYLGGAPLYPVGLVMGALVAIWGPLHLWSIALAFTKDYEKVGIPMFPSMVSRKKAISGVLSAQMLLIASSYSLVLWTDSSLYLIGVTLLNMLMMGAGYKLYKSESNRDGWVLFKLTSPYILLVFLLFMFSYL
ncbi:protoheme IX farnesyltransferase [Candidatus Bathyarchaeota archaeon]|nr:protoheme IX farnesyltransferase [Candidatus Bathyarchaeota archaeon]MBT6604384.1 protoheme IX farnesyltransferase [Candidatus Bathyarchaeota archaeon]MBT7347874.1 protoheme IX farnesyltransferase [Candidatus Bathyarchaeota archaeon]